MSRATTQSTAVREAIYLRQSGRSELTPAQRRRSRHKQNDMARATPRIGRLRRRYDRNDAWYVQAKATQYVSLIRARVSWAMFTPKPNSKRTRQSYRGRGDR